MDKAIILLIQSLILLLAIILYRNANKQLKDKKDQFKKISGQDYDEYIKNKK